MRDLDYSTTLAKVDKALIQECYSKVNGVLEQMENYIRTWLNYQSLWELDIKVIEE